MFRSYELEVRRGIELLEYLFKDKEDFVFNVMKDIVIGSFINSTTLMRTEFDTRTECGCVLARAYGGYGVGWEYIRENHFNIYLNKPWYFGFKIDESKFIEWDDPVRYKEEYNLLQQEWIHQANEYVESRLFFPPGG